MGQLCEEYQAESLGKQQIALPSSINLDVDGAVTADAYGISDKNGYYIVANNNLVARHGSIPLVFGSSGSVELIPHEEIITTQSWQQTETEAWQYWQENDSWQSLKDFDQSEFIISARPSIIFPGCGFLNEAGRNQNYTVECWLNIDSNATTPKRIFGPINSTDGLYVENAFLTLVIGNNFVSHYVGEWFRPMLVHIRLIKDSATLLVNGEEVGELSFITKDLILPEEFTLNDKVAFEFNIGSGGFNTNNFTASINNGGILYNQLAANQAGDSPFATSSIPFISGSINQNTVILNSSLSYFQDYQYLPSGSFTPINSLYNTYGELDYIFSPKQGDIIIIYYGASGNFIESEIEQVSKFNDKIYLTLASGLPSALDISAYTNSTVDKFLILSKIDDETNVILNFNKRDDIATSLGFIIPNNLHPDVLANIDTITKEVKQKLIDLETTNIGSSV
jgi:hypothetical protein